MYSLDLMKFRPYYRDHLNLAHRSFRAGCARRTLHML